MSNSTESRIMRKGEAIPAGVGDIRRPRAPCRIDNKRRRNRGSSYDSSPLRGAMSFLAVRQLSLGSRQQGFEPCLSEVPVRGQRL
jgi:hypothetical protein